MISLPASHSRPVYQVAAYAANTQALADGMASNTAPAAMGHCPFTYTHAALIMLQIRQNTYAYYTDAALSRKT